MYIIYIYSILTQGTYKYIQSIAVTKMKKNLQHLDSKNHEFCALNPASAGCARLGDMARDLDSGGKAGQRATRMSRVRVDVASTDLRAQDRPRQTPVHIAHCPIQIMPNLTHLSI